MGDINVEGLVAYLASGFKFNLRRKAKGSGENRSGGKESEKNSWEDEHLEQ